MIINLAVTAGFGDINRIGYAYGKLCSNNIYNLEFVVHIIIAVVVVHINYLDVYFILAIRLIIFFSLSLLSHICIIFVSF